MAGRKKKNVETVYTTVEIDQSGDVQPLFYSVFGDGDEEDAIDECKLRYSDELANGNEYSLFEVRKYSVDVKSETYEIYENGDLEPEEIAEMIDDEFEYETVWSSDDLSPVEIFELGQNYEPED